MKTIDEVIKAMEYCQTPDQMGNCNVNCPYIHCCDPESVAIKADALHYLKEYRETKKHLACLDDAEIRGDNTQVVNNPPLSWQELQQMEGKPVWVEYIRTSGIYRITFKGWMLIGYISEKLIRFIGTHAQYGFTGEKIVYGDKWNTYKKEHGDYECIVTDLVSGSEVERTIGIL